MQRTALLLPILALACGAPADAPVDAGSTSPDAGPRSEPPAPSTSLEMCDGRDDDVDGEIDEGCSCEVGDQQTCWRAADETDARICSRGLQQCEPAGEFGVWGTCEPRCLCAQILDGTTPLGDDLYRRDVDGDGPRAAYDISCVEHEDGSVTVSLHADTRYADLLAILNEPTDPMRVAFHVRPGVRVGADEEGPALRVGALPAGSELTLINEGRIQGRGGIGGFGGVCGTASSSGEPGGDGVELHYDVIIDSAGGEIWGGGGGGGGGGDGCDEGVCGGLGSGGGGAGSPPGVAGDYSRVPAWCATRGGTNRPGRDATAEQGGAGGGRGGDPGAPGESGPMHGGSYMSAPSPGGAAGAAVRTHGHAVVLVDPPGDLRGAVD